MKKNRIVLGIVLILGVIFLSTGCKAKLKNGEEVAVKINNKNITADNLYKELKNKYAKNIIIDMIDKKIFDDIYKNNEEIEEKVKNKMEYLKKSYGDNWETTLKNAGYDDEDKLEDEMRLSYQRTKAVDDYLKDNISDKEIKEYYENEYVGDISASHILIKVATDGEDGLSDEDAKNKANDLINQLNDGADFATLAKENSDDTGSAVNGGDLGYFNKGQMVEEFEKAAYNLGVNEYTKEPVKTTYGYHIILKTGEKEKESLDKAKDTIKEKVLAKKKEDAKTEIETLDAIRKKYGLKFKDSKLKKIYKEYIDEQLENAEEK